MAAIPFVFNAIAASGIGPESGAKAYTYVKDTATPLAVYTDTGLTTPASNPVVANSLGYMVFYINSTLNYTITIKTANDATTLLQVTYTASGSVIAVTGGTVPNYNSLVSAIDAQLNFQPIDDDLTAYAGLTGTGFVKRTGSGTASTVSETGTGVVVLATSPTLSDPIISGTTPRLDIVETDAGTNEKRTTLVSDAGVFSLQTRTDADAFGENFVRVIRSGTDVTELEINAPVEINPDANTLERGLTINQTGPTSGSTAGPFYFNSVEATVRSTLTGTGGPGGGSSATWVGFQVSVNAGGANFGGVSVMGASTGVVQTVSDTSTADKNGFSSGVYIDATTLGNAYGGSTGATATASSNFPQMHGHESDTFIYTGAVVPVRDGYNAWSGGTARASVIDAAYAVSMSGAGGAAAWGDAFVLSNANGVTPFPLHTTASIVRSATSGTITNGLKLDNVTFTGDLLHFPNFRVTAAGVVTGGTYNGATIDENAWTTYTPTLTSGGGTITTSTAAGRYRRLFGRTMQVAVRATLTTIGTATGALTFTLPVNASTTIPAGILTGREVATTGKGVAGTIQTSTTINCLFADSASVFTGGNGTIVDALITYETAS